MLPRRLAETLRIKPVAEEAELYRLVSDRVRERGRLAVPAESLTLRTVQRMAGSSPQALARGLETIGWPDLARAAARIPSSEKGHSLLELLRRHRARSER